MIYLSQARRIIICLICLLLAGCNNHNKEAMQQKIDEIIPKSDVYVPPKSTIVIPDAWNMPVSIVIGQHSSIKNLLQQLASACHVKVNMDAIEDKTGITYIASNASFLNILKEICRLVHWKILINDRGEITVLDDAPYFYTHEVAFLVNADDAKNTYYSANIDNELNHKTEVEINIWDEIENNIHFLLSGSDNKDVSDANYHENNQQYHTQNPDHHAKVNYSINKQSGMLIVYGTQAQHEQIAHFLQDLHMRIASQIFIEVHILSVDIGTEERNGLSWQITPFGAFDAMNGEMLANSITDAIQFIQKFGPTTIIHSPRTMTRNNIPAIFKAVKEDVYYKISQHRHNLPSGNIIGKKAIFQQNNLDTMEYSSEPKIIKSGIVLMIRPMIIDFINRIVALRLKANLSSKDGDAKCDPIVNIMAKNATVQSEHPVLERKYIDTTITLKHGEAAIIGGLMEDKDLAGVFGLKGGKIQFHTNAQYQRQILFVVSCKVQPMDQSNRQNNKLSQYEIMDFIVHND